VDSDLERSFMEDIVSKFEELSCNFLVWTEETHKEPQ
jgi:hypothetical protein